MSPAYNYSPRGIPGTVTTSKPPTAAGPETILPALLQDLPTLLDEVQKLLAPASPRDAEFMSANREELLASARMAMLGLVHQAARQTAADLTSLGAGQDAVWALFDQVGRNQWLQGLPLVPLLSAYQAGGQTAWRHMSAVALRCDLSAQDLSTLAEALFLLIGRLSSASSDGYLAAQSEQAAAREHLRDLLVELLLSDRSDTAAVQAAAAQARWPLPTTASVIFVEPGDEAGRAALTHLDPLCLPVRCASLPGVVVPDPEAPGRQQRLTLALKNSSAVIGRSVPIDLLPASARIAEIALGLHRRGLFTETPIFVSDHLDSVIVHRDTWLHQALQAQCLAPLERVPASSRGMLRQTLRSWLLHMGDRRRIAADLQVHPQTVRYRLARLREIFGTDLDDPSSRLRLMLSLAWE